MHLLCEGTTSRPVPNGTVLAVPRRRSALTFGASASSSDVCVVATKREKSTGRCLPPRSRSTLCVRVIVARTDDGRRYLDARARAVELSLVLSLSGDVGPIDENTRLAFIQNQLGSREVVGLASPDVSPPAGKVGFFETDAGGSSVAVALLRDGSRRFARIDRGAGGGFSTNLVELYPGRSTVFSVF